MEFGERGFWFRIFFGGEKVCVEGLRKLVICFAFYCELFG